MQYNYNNLKNDIQSGFAHIMTPKILRPFKDQSYINSTTDYDANIVEDSYSALTMFLMPWRTQYMIERGRKKLYAAKPLTKHILVGGWA